jgi:D-sedoheptulose 7-phosphate isomerase
MTATTEPPPFEAFARGYLSGLKAAIDQIDPKALERVMEVLLEAKRDRRTVYVLGNGGSAATASHLASDLCRTEAGTGRRGLEAICLTDNVAAFTAVANDTGFETAFAELLALQVRQGDVVIAISGSGSSPNVLRGVEVARRRGATTVALVGFGGGDLAELVDHAVCLECRHYGVAEDLHLALAHMITIYMSGPRRIEQPDQRPGSSLDS